MDTTTKISVAIVEDNPTFLVTFKETIAKHADLVLLSVATDFASGLAMLKGETADVLLVDLGLPDGSGLGLIIEAAARWPACDVMVVSVFGNQQNVLSALAAGATGYLLKDDDSIDLAEQIRILKAGGSPISPVIARQLLAHLNTPAITPETSPDASTNSNQNQLLSTQEQTVLNLASKGYNYDEVAQIIGVTRHTVATYVKRCYRKLQVNSKAEAIYEARRHGLVKD